MRINKFINSLLIIIVICFYSEAKNLHAQILSKENKNNFRKAKKEMKSENYNEALKLYSAIIG